MTIAASVPAFDQARQDNIPHEHALIRFSLPEDVDRVMTYYSGNRHEHVHIRDRDLLAGRVESGHFLLMLRPDDTIIGSSGEYDYCLEGETSGNHSYAEIGSTRFSPEGNGFGLYPLFIASQVMLGAMQRPPSEMYIANVYDASPVGREMLTKKVGWRVIEPAQAVIDTFKATKADGGDNDNGPMTWYGSDGTCLPHKARVISDFLDNPIRPHKTGERALVLDLSEFPLANDLRSLLDSIADGEWSVRLGGPEGALPLGELSPKLVADAMQEAMPRIKAGAFDHGHATNDLAQELKTGLRAT